MKAGPQPPRSRNWRKQFGVIVVCPDGGFSSWYFDSPEDRKVPHDDAERPGGHDWKYRGNALKYQMLFISDHLAR
jgi:hypothetical protein